jgi:IclR helix-turn-helix domain
MNDPSTTDTTQLGTPVAAMREVTVTLSVQQVKTVVHQVTAFSALAQLSASALEDPKALRSLLTPLLENNSYSQSVLRALIVLASFPVDGSERELTAVASEVGLSPGTTHRYLSTWTAAGLLVRDPVSRRYRRPPLATATTPTD